MRYHQEIPIASMSGRLDLLRVVSFISTSWQNQPIWKEKLIRELKDFLIMYCKWKYDNHHSIIHVQGSLDFHQLSLCQFRVYYTPPWDNKWKNKPHNLRFSKHKYKQWGLSVPNLRLLLASMKPSRVILSISLRTVVMLASPSSLFWSFEMVM